jgi:hypothetical protein
MIVRVTFPRFQRWRPARGVRHRYPPQLPQRRAGARHVLRIHLRYGRIRRRPGVSSMWAIGNMDLRMQFEKPRMSLGRRCPIHRILPSPEMVRLSYRPGQPIANLIKRYRLARSHVDSQLPKSVTCCDHPDLGFVGRPIHVNKVRESIIRASICDESPLVRNQLDSHDQGTFDPGLPYLDRSLPMGTAFFSSSRRCRPTK